MANLNFKGNWNEIRGRLKQRYADLTDDDLMYQEGQEDELLGRLQRKLGREKQDVVNIINNLSRPDKNTF